jgi:hydroxymethylbilane synthase
MSQEKLIIGSRGSDLALWQAHFIRDILTKEHNCQVEIKIIQTSGDRIQNMSFDKMEGKGFFTKELEEELLKKEIDLAVHSLKDLMTTQPDGLKLGAAGYRADRREALLIKPGSREGDGLLPVKPGSIIGTSSARRKCQIAQHAPSLKIKDLRGNVPTRVRKVREDEYDAIIVAAAGISRLALDLSDLEVVMLDAEQFLPAPAQGVLGIQIRSDDARVEAIISKLGSAEELRAALLERGLLARFDGGCSLPLGVVSEAIGDSLRLSAILGQPDGDGWAGLKKAEATGDDIKLIANAVYQDLTGRPVPCDWQ